MCALLMVAWSHSPLLVLDCRDGLRHNSRISRRFRRHISRDFVYCRHNYARRRLTRHMAGSGKLVHMGAPSNRTATLESLMIPMIPDVPGQTLSPSGP